MPKRPPRLTELARGGGCGCKIAPDVLRELTNPLIGGGQLFPDDLLVGPQTRDDAAVYRIDGERALVFSADFFMPMVDDPYHFGFIAATNAISDIFAMGGKPLLALSLLAMPTDKIGQETISRILAGGQDACNATGTAIAGGHSIDSAEPIYGLAVAGAVPVADLLTNAGARDGDAIVLGKPLGIGVLCAAAKSETLGEDGMEALLAHAMKANGVGAELASLSLASAMTDVTGFGLLGHLEELCSASSCAATIRPEEVPMIKPAEALAKKGVATGASARNWRGVKGSVSGWERLPQWTLNILTDPQTSGGLLVTCPKRNIDEVLRLFEKRGFGFASVIGEISGGAPAVRIASAPGPGGGGE